MNCKISQGLGNSRRSRCLPMRVSVVTANSLLSLQQNAKCLGHTLQLAWNKI